MRMPNIIGGILVIAIAVFFFLATFDFPNLAMQDTGPSFMPRIYCGILVFLGVMLIIQGIIDKRVKEKKENTMIYALITVLFVLGYLILVPFVGFYISTSVFVFALLLFSKVRNKIILFSISIGISLFIFVFFEKLLNVSIPIGSLFS